MTTDLTNSPNDPQAVPLGAMGTPHAEELVETIDDVRFINDSRACDPAAAAATLANYQPVYWIVGGKLQAGGFEALTPQLGRIHHAFLMGEASDTLAKWLEEKGVSLTLTDTLERAVKHAALMAKEDDLDGAVVLLSPACPAEDRFPSYEVRGDLFRNAVRALEVEAAG